MEPDESAEMVRLLREMRDIHRDAAKKQEEVLAFMRAQAEETKIQIAHSISLQEVSVARQKVIQAVALPVIVVCLGLVALLIYRYGV